MLRYPGKKWYRQKSQNLRNVGVSLNSLMMLAVAFQIKTPKSMRLPHFTMEAILHLSLLVRQERQSTLYYLSLLFMLLSNGLTMLRSAHTML